MYCKNCGSPMDTQAAICVKCGYQKGTGNHYCDSCGTAVDPGAAACTNCGHGLRVEPVKRKSKLAAGLLGIFLGGLGIHNFYLGNTSRAVVQILLNFFCCGIGGVWGLVEGILILTGKIDRDANGDLLDS